MPTMTKAIIGLAVLAVLLAAPVGAGAQSAGTPEQPAARALLDDAAARLAADDAAGAYALLAPREAELAGNAWFDYLLGVAALDTGRSGEAIFSLRRSLAVEPRFSGAKMELARAYFEAGNHDQARPLFVALLGEQPPRGVGEVLTRYIDAIDARPAAPRPRFSPYAEFTAGYDTNANGSTDSGQFLGFTLSPENVETDSPFAELGAGFSWSIPRSRSFAWYLGGRASYRDNPDADFVDAGLASGVGGASWRRGPFFGRAGLDAYGSLRDGESNETYAGADLKLGRQLGTSWELSAALRYGRLSHDSSIDVLDVDRLLYTLGASWRYSALGSLKLEFVGGEDDEREAGSPYGNSKLGGRLSLSAPLGEHILFASVGSLTSDYDGLFFGGPREDTQRSTVVQLEFRDVFTDGLSISPRVRYVDNESDVALYEYDRTEVGLTIR